MADSVVFKGEDKLVVPFCINIEEASIKEVESLFTRLCYLYNEYGHIADYLAFNMKYLIVDDEEDVIFIHSLSDIDYGTEEVNEYKYLNGEILCQTSVS